MQKGEKVVALARHRQCWLMQQAGAMARMCALLCAILNDRKLQTLQPCQAATCSQSLTWTWNRAQTLCRNCAKVARTELHAMPLPLQIHVDSDESVCVGAPLRVRLQQRRLYSIAGRELNRSLVQIVRASCFLAQQMSGWLPRPPAGYRPETDKLCEKSCLCFCCLPDESK